MSTNTDATHFTSCKGMLRIEDSEFEGHGDDATNVHAYYHSLIPTGERRCRLRLDSPTWTHSQTLDYPDPGDRLELVSRDSLRTKRTYRVVTAEPDFPAASAIPAVRDMGEAVNSEWKMKNAHSCIFRKQKAKDSRQAVFFMQKTEIIPQCSQSLWIPPESPSAALRHTVCRNPHTTWDSPAFAA